MPKRQRRIYGDRDLHVLAKTASVLILCMLAGCARLGPSTVPPGFKYPEMGESVAVEQPFSATRLAGKVIDSAGSPIKQALVEVTGENWSDRQAARFTNERGRFEFRGMKGNECLLKITKYGFKPLLVRVKIDKSAGQELNLTMHVAT